VFRHTSFITDEPVKNKGKRADWVPYIIPDGLNLGMDSAISIPEINMVLVLVDFPHHIFNSHFA
jgi:hypothetical protein